MHWTLPEVKQPLEIKWVQRRPGALPFVYPLVAAAARLFAFVAAIAAMARQRDVTPKNNFDFFMIYIAF